MGWKRSTGVAEQPPITVFPVKTRLILGNLLTRMVIPMAKAWNHRPEAFRI